MGGYVFKCNKCDYSIELLTGRAFFHENRIYRCPECLEIYNKNWGKFCKGLGKFKCNKCRENLEDITDIVNEIASKILQGEENFSSLKCPKCKEGHLKEIIYKITWD
jgi:Zn finger protein HypA/HybF involved in hydrogenase expression